MANDLSDLLAADEIVILETRQHWFVVLSDLVVHLLALVVVAVAIWYVGSAGWLDNTFGTWVGYLLWAAFAVLAAICLWRTFGWITERFYVTSNKVVYAYGILNRNVVSTPLVKIDEMTLRRPLLGRVLGFGRLDVANASGGEEPLAGLEYLPRPTKLYQMINERSRNQRMVEGGAYRDDDNDGIADRRATPAPPAATDGEQPDASSSNPTS